MPLHKPNQTSFKPGHVRSQESIEKQRTTLKKRGLPEHFGKPWTDEQRAKHAATKRRKSLGNKYRKGVYVQVMTESGLRYEHRIVMEQLLGRPLTSKEHVHHINGIGHDNRPENLVVISHSDHSRHHGHERSLENAVNAWRLKPGEWSKLGFTECQDCGSSKRPHFSRGLCRNCHARWYRRSRRS